jgi:hypothetical protein
MRTPLSRQEVEELYGFAFPESLYAFHQFISTLSERHLWDWLGLRLEGPLRLMTEGADPSSKPPYTNRCAEKVKPPERTRDRTG